MTNLGTYRYLNTYTTAACLAYNIFQKHLSPSGTMLFFEILFRNPLARL